jgi:hypothetical protein
VAGALPIVLPGAMVNGLVVERDHCNVYVGSRRAGERTLVLLRQRFTRRLRLRKRLKDRIRRITRRTGGESLQAGRGSAPAVSAWLEELEELLQLPRRPECSAASTSGFATVRAIQLKQWKRGKTGLPRDANSRCVPSPGRKRGRQHTPMVEERQHEPSNRAGHVAIRRAEILKAQR